MLKGMDSEAVQQVIDINPVSSTQKVSGKLGISQSSMVCHFYNQGKSIQSY